MAQYIQGFWNVYSTGTAMKLLIQGQIGTRITY
jgi:hypothetical protein